MLSDLGATLQILRLAGREYGNTEDRPNRIEDCISDLGLRSCLNTVATQITARSDRSSEIAEIWAHSREIAHHSKLIAEDIPEVNPEDAYLVGLLHAIGLLPDLLGWNGRETDAFESAHIAFMMATQWSLPHVVVDAFRAMCHADEESEWTAILMSAHQRAIARSIDCPYRQERRPLLYKPIQNNFAVYAGSASL